MKTTSDVIGDFLSTMDTTVYVSAVATSPDTATNWRCTVSKYQWLGKTTLSVQRDRPITGPNSTVYTVNLFRHDEWFEIAKTDSNGDPVAQPPTGLYTLPKYRFMPGTPLAVGAELVDYMEGAAPLIWLMEIMQEDVIYERRKGFMFPKLRMFFLVDANFSDWTNADHLEYAIRPARNMADRFLVNACNSGNFQDPKGMVTFINHARFGLAFNQPKTQDNFSHQTNIFSEKLSGVEIRVELPILRSCYS